MRRALVALLFVVACGGSGSDSELTADQGPCMDLDATACAADDRCQQAYEDSGFQPMPFPSTCLLLEPKPLTSAACDTLDKEACRARADCSPLYWQELGPDDGPVGDPYYTSCIDEP